MDRHRIVVIIVLLVIYLIAAYNGLIRRRNQIENAWSQIDVQLKRRHDLIPNLVETVKGYAAHEKSTLDAVIRARNAAVAAPTPNAQAAAEGQLTGALRQVFALGEAYPDLKANQNFLALQEELTATEGRVAYARQFYNDSVLDYNNKLQQFPTVYFARMLKLRAARVLRGRRGGAHDAYRRVLTEPRRRTCCRHLLQPSPPHVRPHPIEQAPQHAARGRLRRSSSPWSAPPSACVFGNGLVGHDRGARDRRRGGVRLVLEGRQDRARRQPRPPRRSRSSTPGCTTSSRACASPAGSRSPACTSIDDPAPNAFATGRDPKHAAIAVTTGLLEKMNRVELEGVVAHELSHIRNYDILDVDVGGDDGRGRRPAGRHRRSGRCGGTVGASPRTATAANSGNPLAIVGFVLLIMAPIVAKAMQAAISRQRETLADVSACQMTRYPPGLISALEKLQARHDGDARCVDCYGTLVDRTTDERGRRQWSPGRNSPAVRHPPPLDERIALLREL